MNLDASSKNDYSYNAVHNPNGSESDDRDGSLGSIVAEKTLWAKICQTWLFEFLGFVAGLTSLAATVALLRKHDGERVPDWPVSLNFVLSLLANVGFAGTLFAVHAAVAQLKWVWFTKGPRPLADLSVFQNVRGGAIGAVQLLFTAGTQLAVITGSLAILLGMLWGPFTQNLILFESRDIESPEGDALATRSVVFEGRGVTTRYAYHLPDPRLEISMLSSIAAAPNDRDVNEPRFFCSTGNCTWPPFATLAFCATCTDLTPQIDMNCTYINQTCRASSECDKPAQECRPTTPGNVVSLYANQVADYETFFTTQRVLKTNETRFGSSSLRYQSIRRLPMPYPTLSSTGREPVTIANFSATECSLNVCVQSINATVQNGKYEENIIATYEEEDFDGSSFYGETLRPPWTPELGIDPTENLNFSLAGGKATFDETNWAGLIESDKIQTVDGRSGFEMPAKSAKLGVSIFTANYNAKDCGSINDDVFSCVMQGFAKALTKTVRDSGLNKYGKDANSSYLIRGRATVPATFIHVRWEWIILPALVWVFGFITWCAIVIQTWRLRLPKWRDDLLPLVFLYRGGDARLRDAHTSEKASPTVTASSCVSRDLDKFLGADDYSSWAYGKVAEQIIVQLHKPGSVTENAGAAGVRHLA